MPKMRRGSTPQDGTASGKAEHCDRCPLRKDMEESSPPPRPRTPYVSGKAEAEPDPREVVITYKPGPMTGTYIRFFWRWSHYDKKYVCFRWEEVDPRRGKL